MNAKTIIGLVIIGVTMIWGISSFLDSTIVYVSIAEAKTSSEMVQVMGKISKEEVSYNSEESRLEFTIYDGSAGSFDILLFTGRLQRFILLDAESDQEVKSIKKKTNDRDSLKWMEIT